jgi:hypothetical protein
MSTPDGTSPPPEPGTGTVSRRVLLGSGLLVLGAVGGGVAAFASTEAPREVVPDPVPPADVLAAVERERTLLALYDAAGSSDPLLAHVRADHAAHEAALTALLPAQTSSSASGSVSAPASASAAPTVARPSAADLVAAEQRAADAARTACLAGNGTAAVLLACIAASEASHAAVLR